MTDGRFASSRGRRALSPRRGRVGDHQSLHPHRRRHAENERLRQGGPAGVPAQPDRLVVRDEPRLPVAVRVKRTMPKTTPKTVDAYIAAAPPATRAKLRQLRPVHQDDGAPGEDGQLRDSVLLVPRATGVLRGLCRHVILYMSQAPSRAGQGARAVSGRASPRSSSTSTNLSR